MTGDTTLVHVACIRSTAGAGLAHVDQHRAVQSLPGAPQRIRLAIGSTACQHQRAGGSATADILGTVLAAQPPNRKELDATAAGQAAVVANLKTLLQAMSCHNHTADALYRDRREVGVNGVVRLLDRTRRLLGRR